MYNTILRMFQKVGCYLYGALPNLDAFYRVLRNSN